MNNQILENIDDLSDEQIIKTFNILFGNVKDNYGSKYKINEMQSIFRGGTQPCVPFENWVKLIDFLTFETSKVKN
jgi:hypothetical protein